jgi:hypothetical protein
MKTAPTNKKVRELISMVREGKLIPRPEFQRRLVWTRDDKNHFLDSILRKFPFPEIYFADGDVDLETGQGTQLLVDGLQRVSTIIQYFNGDPELKLTTVPAYKDLSENDKRDFLQYDVSVRDLGSITKGEIIEVFRRINATKYSLLDIEVNNAVYAGALKRFATEVADSEFFKGKKVFTAADFKRMGDLRFALLIVSALLDGYSNRDDAFEGLLSRYNDDFPEADEIRGRMSTVFSFLEECGFTDDSRVWRKADLFSVIVEIDRALNARCIKLTPSEVVERLGGFLNQVDTGELDHKSLAGVYYKAALQASNDKVNRLRRGIIIGGILAGGSEKQIYQELGSMGLI